MNTPTPYEFVDMNPLVRQHNLKKSYYAGSQLDLLDDAFDVKWLAKEMVGDYQGEWYAIFKKDGRVFLLNGYFGSCSGCDDLADANPVEWLKDSVKNVRAFDTTEAAVQWLETSEEFSYTDIKKLVLRDLKKEQDQEVAQSG